jgi:hypothetical protein
MKDSLLTSRFYKNALADIYDIDATSIKNLSETLSDHTNLFVVFSHTDNGILQWQWERLTMTTGVSNEQRLLPRMDHSLKCDKCGETLAGKRALRKHKQVAHSY